VSGWLESRFGEYRCAASKKLESRELELKEIATSQALLNRYCFNNRIFNYVRFGSLADLFGNDRRMSASAGKAATQHTNFESSILNVCFSR
jgi:hypothetical protein